MLTINENNAYITKEDDHYSIALLNVNDSVRIELDMPLKVLGDLSVAGSLDSNTDVTADGTIHVQGNVTGSTLASKTRMTIVGAVQLGGSIRSRGEIKLYGKSAIEGNLVADNSLRAFNKVSVGKNISVKELFFAHDEVYCSERISVGMMFMPEAKVHCDGEIKVAGEIINTYAVVKNATGTLVLMDDMAWVKKGDSISNPIVEVEKMVNEINQKEDKSAKELDFLIKATFAKKLSTPFKEVKKRRA